MKNYYNILGVPENASDVLITEAYKKLALKFHPDINAGDVFFAERFKQINEAYQVLKKQSERKEYDDMLFNYADAYEILKFQQQNEVELRTDKRKRNKKYTIRNSGWWVIGSVALICASIFFLLNDSDSKGFTKGVVYKNEAYTSKKEEIPGQLLSPTKSVLNIKNTENVNKKIASNKNIPSSEIPKKSLEKTKDELNSSVKGRALSENEISDILSQLRAKKTNKGVRITQSLNSDIQKDFAIVSILHENGYYISGRTYTSQDFAGIQVNETSDYLNLIIGNTSTNASKFKE